MAEPTTPTSKQPLTAESLGNMHGLQCPRCKSGASLRIATRVWATLYPDGNEILAHGNEWDENSDALCNNDDPEECGWFGKVSDLLTVQIAEKARR